MEYEIPQPIKEPAKSLVIFYKVSKGIEYDDRLWDKKHFGRSMVSASELLEICKGFGPAKKCIQEIAARFDELGMSWTLETIVKQAHDWQVKRGIRNDAQIRKRFYDAVVKQRTNREGQDNGGPITAGEVLGSLGNLENLLDTSWGEERSADPVNGEIGD